MVRINVEAALGPIDFSRADSSNPAYQMLERTGNRILIVGQAKTGTTALFYKIKHALPATTRCLFEPLEYTESRPGARGHVLAKVLIRDIKPARVESFESFERKLLIVRDPRDTLVSSILYSIFHAEDIDDTERVQNLIRLLEQKEQNPSEIALQEIITAVDQLNPGQSSCLDSFLKNLGLYCQFHSEASGYHQVRYEDFIAGHLESVESYLGLSLGQPARVGFRVQRVARTKSSGDWKNWLLSEDINMLRPVLGDAMRQFGYSDDWSISASRVIRREHCSQYVKRLLSERKQSASFPYRVARRLSQTLSRSQ